MNSNLLCDLGVKVGSAEEFVCRLASLLRNRGELIVGGFGLSEVFSGQGFQFETKRPADHPGSSYETIKIDLTDDNVRALCLAIRRIGGLKRLAHFLAFSSGGIPVAEATDNFEFGSAVNSRVVTPEFLDQLLDKKMIFEYYPLKPSAPA